MSRIVIPGGSGFLGQALAAVLVERGDEVVILSRSTRDAVPGTRTVLWDAETLGPWAEELDGADAIVHLNGRRVDVRATKRNIDELISSR
ncbi:MAG: NAD-dependent epimerase/dehydratase, partial [Ilumatobacteraceae bacterium]|nr:NAD-dependent epimerase/dehydratase [Ilumatobacteraceae bacterium]